MKLLVILLAATCLACTTINDIPPPKPVEITRYFPQHLGTYITYLELQKNGFSEPESYKHAILFFIEQRIIFKFEMAFFYNKV